VTNHKEPVAGLRRPFGLGAPLSRSINAFVTDMGGLDCRSEIRLGNVSA
jgi:hypothetical protein